MSDSPPEVRLAQRLKLDVARVPSLRRALQHISYVHEQGGGREESNERLEFLGDAVLGAIVADELYRRYPRSSEGELTVVRALLVRKSTLARWARTLELGQLALLGQPDDRPGEREREALLSQVFEAMVGAVYFDRGWARARALVRRFVAAELRQGDPLKRALDAKSRLQQRSQALYGVTPHYQEISSSGPDHDPLCTVRVLFGDHMELVASGRGKRAAEQAAAQEALAVLERLHPTEPVEDSPA